MGRSPGVTTSRSVGWLASIASSEALPGRGLKCWLSVPLPRIDGVLPAVLAGRAASALAPGGSARSLSKLSMHDVPDDRKENPAGKDVGDPPTPDSSAETGAPGSGGAVEVRLALGNRRLMQEEGVALSPQVGGAQRRLAAASAGCRARLADAAPCPLPLLTRACGVLLPPSPTPHPARWWGFSARRRP